MENFFGDLRVSLRGLTRRPAFALVVLLTLGLGIGASVTIFSVVHTILLAPLPFAGPEEVMVVWETKGERRDWTVSAANFLHWQEHAGSFEQLASLRPTTANLTGEGEPEQLSAVLASAELFQVLKVEPFRGRLFTAEDGRSGAPEVVVLTHGFWRRRFGADPGVVGKTLLLNGTQRVVVGILPADFRTSYKRTEEVFLPQKFDPELASSVAHFFLILGRLKPGVSMQQAQLEMDSVAKQLATERPVSNEGWGVNVLPIHEQLFGEFRPILFLLLGAVALLLLVACVNVAHLLMVRNSARRQDTAVRLALGATKVQLGRLHLLEVLALAAGGGILGVAFALVSLRTLAVLSPGDIPRLDEAGLNLPVLAFAFGVVLLSALVVVAVPAVSSSRMDLRESLGEGSLRSGSGQQRSRALLVAAESALVLVLLVGAGLMVRSFQELGRVDPGFQVDDRVAVEINLPAQRYPELSQIRQAVDQISERVAAIPGVRSVGVSTRLPIAQRSRMISLVPDNRANSPGDEDPTVRYDAVASDYLQAMGIPLLEGRSFGPEDHEDSPLVILVNQELATRFWPGESAVGRKITGTPPEGPWLTVIGVMGNVRQQNLEVKPVPEVFQPFSQLGFPLRSIQFVVASQSGSTASLVPAIRDVVRKLDPDQPVAAVMPLSEILVDAVARPRFQMILLVVFALSALLLGAVGIYGVVGFLISQSQREIGIRMAMGAQNRDILRWVLTIGLFPVVLGAGIGIIAAIGLSRLLESLLYGVAAHDPLTFLTVPLFLLAIALIATWVPARRAVRIDPAATLRCD